MDFVKLSEQRFTAKKFDVNKKIPRDDVEKLKTILQLSPSSVNSQPWDLQVPFKDWRPSCFRHFFRKITLSQKR